MQAVEMIKRLKKEAEHNELAKNVFLVWGSRERARRTVSIVHLMTTMNRHKFHYSRDKYEEFLKFLADIGLGQLHWNSRGNVDGLVNLSITLQSIGKTACQPNETLKSFKIRNKFEDLQSEIKETSEKPQPFLTMSLELAGQKIELPLSVKEIIEVLADIRNKKAAV